MGIGAAGMILDTNALSAFADGRPEVVKALARAKVLALPVVVIGEYRYGIAQSRERARYARWFDQLIRDSTVLDVTEQTALHYAALHLLLRRSGKPIPTNDLWIAALCRQHHLPLLSRDRHFDAVPGVARVEW